MPDGAVDRSMLLRMRDTMVHRGPDDAGLAVDGPLGVAMRRLSIIDLEGGSQPIFNESGTVAVVCNGEIYNFRDLRSELISRGHRFSTGSDAEVLVHLYEERSDALCEPLNGMFAFAVLDMGRRRLLLGRDRLGIKPLYYALVGGKLVFGSEPAAVMASGLVPDELDPLSLDEYLRHLYVPEPASIYRALRRLEPGCVLSYEAGEVRVERYWQPVFAPRPVDEDEAAGRLFDLVADSVRMRLVADVPVGLLLSGGLDSSIVGVMMRRAGADPIRTFTVGFAERDQDERSYARVLSRAIGSEHHELLARPDAAELLPRLVRGMGEPFADPSMLPTYMICKFARERVKVVLGGDGGDEIMAGYTWAHMALLAARFGRLPAGLRKAVGAAAVLFSGGRRAKVRRFLDDAAMSTAEGFVRRQTTLPQGKRDSLLSPDLLDEVRRARRNRIQEVFESLEGLDDGTRMLATDTLVYLPGDILTKVDRMSMAVSLEARVPLLDHRIVEYCAALPFDLKLRGRTSKYLLKKAAAALLPRELLRQRKHGFSIPVRTWTAGPLRDMVSDLLLSGGEYRSYLDADAVKRIVEDHWTGREDGGYAIWALVVFELWLRARRGIRMGAAGDD